MKISIVSFHTLTEFGGYERVLLSVFKILSQNYNCKITYISVPYYKSYLNKPVLEEFLDFKVLRSSDYNDRWDYRKYVLQRRILNNELIINHKSIENHINELASSDVVVVTEALLINSIKNIFSKNKIDKKVLHWDHGDLNGYFRSINSNSKNFLGYFKRSLRKFIYHKEMVESLKLADAHLCISSEIGELIKSIDNKAKIYNVYNPVPPYYGPLVKRSSSPIFLYVGRLEDNQKNISFLLKGLSYLKHKDWKLIVIGAGPDESKLKELALNLGISDKIQWLGFKKDPFSEIKEVTALILTSRWEGFPMVLVEANQRGIPVISSDCKSGPKDIIIPGKNGYLYKEGNMDEFVKIVNQAIDSRLKFDTPENISKTADRFREDIVVSNIYNALNEVVNKNMGKPKEL